MKSLNQTVKITDPTKVTKILEKSLNIADSAYLTFALYNTKAAPELLVFEDVLPVNIDTNKTYVRLINLMSDGQTVSFFQKGKVYTVYFVGSIAQPNTSIGKLGNGVFVNR